MSVSNEDLELPGFPHSMCLLLRIDRAAGMLFVPSFTAVSYSGFVESFISVGVTYPPMDPRVGYAITVYKHACKHVPPPTDLTTLLLYPVDLYWSELPRSC